jgi:hypothetical protein
VLLAFGVAAFSVGSASAACVQPYCAAPAAQTGSATAITATSATLNGTVAANGSGPTGWQFQLGTSPASLGTVASGTGPDGYGAAPVSFNATGLTPSTTYFFRVIVSNSGGSSLGSIQSFTTQAAPPPNGGDNQGGNQGGNNQGGGEPSTNPKLDPADISIRARPSREPSKPYRYTISGTVRVSDTSACSGGQVTVRFTRAGESIKKQSASLDSDCKYSTRVTVPSGQLSDNGGRLNVTALFGGNARLNDAASGTIKVSYGGG